MRATAVSGSGAYLVDALTLFSDKVGVEEELGCSETRTANLFEIESNY